jgi:hypothetical protein
VDQWDRMPEEQIQRKKRMIIETNMENFEGRQWATWDWWDDQHKLLGGTWENVLASQFPWNSLHQVSLHDTNKLEGMWVGSGFLIIKTINQALITRLIWFIIFYTVCEFDTNSLVEGPDLTSLFKWVDSNSTLDI